MQVFIYLFIYLFLIQINKWTQKLKQSDPHLVLNIKGKDRQIQLNRKNRAQLFKTNDVVSKHIVKTLIINYCIYANIFTEKMWVAFAKATHICSAKNTCELDIVLTRTVNILTTNELVKLTTLWTTGIRIASIVGNIFPKKACSFVTQN